MKPLAIIAAAGIVAFIVTVLTVSVMVETPEGGNARPEQGASGQPISNGQQRQEVNEWLRERNQERYQEREEGLQDYRDDMHQGNQDRQQRQQEGIDDLLDR